MSQEMPLAIVNVTSTTYPNIPQITCGFTPNGYSFQNMDYSDTVLVSLDGTNTVSYAPNGSIIEGVQQPGTPNNYPTSKTTIYLKLKSPGSAMVYVQGTGS